MAMVAVFTATTPRPGGLSCLLIVSPLSGRALTTMMTNLSMAPSLMSLRMNPLVRRQAASRGRSPMLSESPRP